MRKIQKIMPAALDEDLRRLGRAQVAMKRWNEVVGPALSARSYPDRFDHGVVWVAVEGSAWAQELRLMKTKILDRLCEVAEEPGLFRDVRFGVRKLPETVATVPPPEPQNSSDRRELTISEIAQRRLDHWRNGEPV